MMMVQSMVHRVGAGARHQVERAVYRVSDL